MFDRYGYRATSLSDIVAHAGVTKGALYFHFSSKEDLAKAVVQEQHSLWMSQAQSFAELRIPALEALIRMSYGLATQLRSHPVIRGGIRLTLENGTFEVPMPDPYLDWISLSVQLLEQATSELDVRTNVELDRVAQFIVSSFTGIHLVAQVLDDRRDVVERVADMWRIILPGLVLSRKLSYYLGFLTSASKELREA